MAARWGPAQQRVFRRDVVSARRSACDRARPWVPGPYAPMLDHTDDYPHIESALHVGVHDIGKSSGLALLFTESQGELHAPWLSQVASGWSDNCFARTGEDQVDDWKV